MAGIVIQSRKAARFKGGKTMLKRIFKVQKGFTLIELLAVLAIIGVLAATVNAAISGTKGASIDGQVQSDGSAVGTGTDNYNTNSLDSDFPDKDLSDAVQYEDPFNAGGGIGVGVTLLDSEGNPIGTGTTLASLTLDQSGELIPVRRAIDFAADTEGYTSDGTIKSLSFVPGFLGDSPSSVILEGAATRNLDDNPIREYLWLYEVTSPGSEQEGRKVEAYRLDSAICVTGGFDFSIFDTAVADVGTAKTDLTASLEAKDVAEETLEDARDELSDAKAALARAQDVGAGVGAAQTRVDNAQGVVNTAVTALDSAEGLVVTETTDVNTAISALVSLQITQIGLAVTADAACSGSNEVMNLSYKRAF